MSDPIPTDVKLAIQETVVIETYNNWNLFYSKKNWVKYWPTWDELGEDTKEFWRNHVKTILHKVKVESLALKSKI